MACAIGLSFADLVKLDKEQIVSMERDYLFVERQKTKVKAYIPLLDEAIEILQRYNYGLPKPLYCGYNKRVQRLCKMAGITKEVSTHTGRKTFGDLMLNKYNVPLEVVSNMMCHTNIATTARYYAKASIEKVRKNTSHIK